MPKIFMKRFAPPEVVEAVNKPEIIKSAEEEVFKHIKTFEIVHLGN